VTIPALTLTALAVLFAVVAFAAKMDGREW